MPDDNVTTAPTFYPSSARMPASGAALGVLTTIVLAALALHALSWRSVGTTLITVVAALGLGFATARWSLRDAADGRHTRVAALALLGFVPLLAVEARRALGEPLPSGSDTEAAFGAIALALPSFTVVGALAWHGAASASSDLGRFVRVTCVLTIAACGGLLVVGLAMPHDALPQVAELEPLSAHEDGFWEDRADHRGDAPFELGRSCIGGSCFAYVRSGRAVRSIGPRFARDARVALLATDDSQHLVLSANGQAIAVAPVVLDDDTLGTWPGAAFAARAGLPVSFLALAALGLGIAMLGAVRRRGLSRKLAALAAAHQAWVLDNGWLALDSGAVHRSLPGMAPGPLLLEEPPQSHAYRGAEQDEAARVHLGTRAELVHQLGQDRTSVDAFVVGWLIPLATPLWVALAFAYL